MLWSFDIFSGPSHKRNANGSASNSIRSRCLLVLNPLEVAAARTASTQKTSACASTLRVHVFKRASCLCSPLCAMPAPDLATSVMASALERLVPVIGCSKLASSDGKDAEGAECGTAGGTPQQDGAIIYLVGVGGPLGEVRVKPGGIERIFEEVCRVAARGLGWLQADICLLWESQPLSFSLFAQLVTSSSMSSCVITAVVKPGSKPVAKAFRAWTTLRAATPSSMPASRRRREGDPGRALTNILRWDYDEGFVELSALAKRYRRLGEHSLEALKATVRESHHRGGPASWWRLGRGPSGWL